MVESQVRGSGVTNAPILASMRAIPREDFVPAGRRDVAYIDDMHQFTVEAPGRFMAAPVTLGKLLKLAEITADETVLDIGTATGYSAAVIARLARSVTALESHDVLAETARANMAVLEIANVEVVTGAISAVGEARFDVIVVQGALDNVPEPFIAALRDGGRLVALIRSGAISVANVFVRSGSEVSARADFSAHLPRLFPTLSREEFAF